MGTSNETIEEMLARFEEEDKKFEEMRNDPAYDGESPSLTKAEELEFYRERAIRNKADILRMVEDLKDYFNRSAKKRGLPIERLIPLLDQFAREISELEIMELLQDWWQYGIAVRETDITLRLDHTEVYYDYPASFGEKNMPVLSADQSFAIHTTKARLLSPEEYGQLHGVSDGTVRQWIRRGKIRSASKFGKEWRIPELVQVPSGHYVAGSYSWKVELPDVPEEFAYLNQFDNVSISSVRGEKDKWYVRFDSREMGSKAREEYLDSKAKERLELYLIAEPLVDCDNNYFGDFCDKTGASMVEVDEDE